MTKTPAIAVIETASIDARALLDEYSSHYQTELTKKLDAGQADVTQALINEIILWKVNRYASLTEPTLALLNSVSVESGIIDVAHTRSVLVALLSTKGIQLAMASSILRFRNPKLYQIIDQRVYRFVCGGEALKYPSKIDDQIDYYLVYLQVLRQKCDQYGIAFKDADRVFYQADKKLNADFALSGY